MLSKVIGLEEVLKYLKGVEKIPQRSVTRISKNATKIALAAAQGKAPGKIKQALIIVAEKTKKKGKKAHQVVISSAYNDEFVKYSSDGSRYYYPASMEYGYRDRSGKKQPGKHYLRDALVNNADEIDNYIVTNFLEEMDKIK